MGFSDIVLATIPLVPSLVCMWWIHDSSTIKQLIFSVVISSMGFIATNSLIPVFSEYTLKRGLSGKDLGKKGTPLESRDVPEALGIVCGVVFLVCTITSQLIFAKNDKQMIVYNSSLFSVCFMILLGFMDDTMELKWRYKLILPTVASLPLLMSYSGSTAMYLPRPFANLLMQNNELTLLGQLLNIIVTVDREANGRIVELGYFFLLFMGLQAVFCTNAINILAGINGLECGQSYIIGATLLFFKLYEVSQTGVAGENELFAILLVLPFLGVCLGLLRHNWFPSAVFVGDTFCYFAGMTFAVVGIHSHFSKTLLMLFIPQIINFLYSVPQLFKVLPCPRHRLPRIDPATKLMTYSTFPCDKSQYKLFKVNKDDETCPNCTIINAALRLLGPTHEKTLTIILLAFQIACSGLAFYIRYFVLEE
jgi:UDP-N-acetylglucosamine--dolichyl-phosphate N-acetylglucosaminephosphotransferase